MVAATLNGKACSLELPPDCLSVADATSFAKSKLSAVWAEACPAAHERGVVRFDGNRLWDLSWVYDTGVFWGPLPWFDALQVLGPVANRFGVRLRSLHVAYAR